MRHVSWWFGGMRSWDLLIGKNAPLMQSDGRSVLNSMGFSIWMWRQMHFKRFKGFKLLWNYWQKQKVFFKKFLEQNLNKSVLCRAFKAKICTKAPSIRCLKKSKQGHSWHYGHIKEKIRPLSCHLAPHWVCHPGRMSYPLHLSYTSALTLKARNSVPQVLFWHELIHTPVWQFTSYSRPFMDL